MYFPSSNVNIDCSILQQDFEKFKTVNVISKEQFDEIIPQEKIQEQEVPPPPPPVETETGKEVRPGVVQSILVEK